MTEQQPNKEGLLQIRDQSIVLHDFTSQGWILDIGGGGEGVIEQLKGQQVIAIDPLRQELEDTNNESLKLVMNAKELAFVDNSFNCVTSFFTLLYIATSDWDIVFQEIARVLKPQGDFLLWDVTINSQDNIKEFQVPLHILLPSGKKINTGYGIGFRSQCKAQNAQKFTQIAEKHNFKVVTHENYDQVFFLHFKLVKKH